MCGTIVCVATILLGIDAGWQTLPDGGIEYQIQIEPEVIADLGASGVLIQSDVPPEVRDIRAFRITVGKSQLPRETAPAESTNPTQPSDATTSQPAADPLIPPPTTPSIAPDNSSWLPPLGRSPAVDSTAEHFPAVPSKIDNHDTVPATLPEPATVPQSFSPDPNGKPLGVRPAALTEPTDAGVKPDTKADAMTNAEQSSRQEGSPKPWLSLTLTALALFASLGLNIYLFWMAADFRRRYHRLAGTMEGVAMGSG